MTQEYEIRLRRNTWDRKGGWNWRVYSIPGFGKLPAVVKWGWEPSIIEAQKAAAYALQLLEENVD